MDEDKVLSYTNYMGDLMSSVTDIINVMSYVLIAFVTISLVVSSIMIGVITYISVLERKKKLLSFLIVFFLYLIIYIFL
jgi:putative ABC transport system permease protein